MSEINGLILAFFLEQRIVFIERKNSIYYKVIGSYLKKFFTLFLFLFSCSIRKHNKV